MYKYSITLNLIFILLALVSFNNKSNQKPINVLNTEKEDSVFVFGYKTMKASSDLFKFLYFEQHLSESIKNNPEKCYNYFGLGNLYITASILISKELSEKKCLYQPEEISEMWKLHNLYRKKGTELENKYIRCKNKK